MPENQKPRGASGGEGVGPSGVALFIGAAVVGFGISLLVYFLVRGPGGREPFGPGLSGQSPPAVQPLFVDVSAEAGIRYRHHNGSTGKFYYPEVMGAGCAFLDYDGDGDLDVYLVNGNHLPPLDPDPTITNVLYSNNGDGTFRDVTAAAGVGDPSYGQGCVAADYDGDGDEDLYVTNFGPNVLYRNRGDGTFERLGGVLADEGWGQAAAFFDKDGDGDLDLYVQNYLEYSLADHKDWPVWIGGEKVLDYCSPQGYRGQQDRLFENDGNGEFRDVTESSGIVMPEGTGMGLACADLDDDGDMDVVVSNDSRPNFFFQNDGQGHFTERALLWGLAYNVEGGAEAFMGIDVGDYDQDGRLDLVVPSLRSQGFNLYRNLGESFADVSVGTGVEVATSAVTGFAPVFLDYDSDGDLDLLFTAGEVRMGSTEAGAEGTFEERYSMRSLLLENRGGRFVDVSPWAGAFFATRAISRACSAGDYDNDGDVDLLVTSMGGPARLLRNDTSGGHWVGFRLVGRAPNPDAIGARLTLRASGQAWTQEVYAGGSYLGQRDRRVVFGLGDRTTFESLQVRWPSGQETTHAGLEIGKYHELRE